MFLTPFYLTLFYQTQILQTLIFFTLICMIAIRPAALRCGLDLLQLLYVQVHRPGQRLQTHSPSLGIIASPCSLQALWVASGRVFASLAPGPGMASAAAVSYIESVAQRLFQGSPMKRTGSQADHGCAAAAGSPVGPQ
jgi:hypothetical protein